MFTYFSLISFSGDPESCVLTAETLDAADFPVRTLTVQGGLFYAGLLNAVTPPDLYSIVLNGERASRPNIYSREEILQDTVSNQPSFVFLFLFVSSILNLCIVWMFDVKRSLFVDP